MPRLRGRIEFDGGPHCGWQSQDPDREKSESHGTSIQSEIERALTLALRQKGTVSATGCGRTDAGVSAEEYFFHFDLEFTPSLAELEKIRHGMNGILPPSISVTHLELANENFHAIESVVSKTYRYSILFRRAKPSIERDRLYWLSISPEHVDLELIERICARFEGEHDFRAFCAAHAAAKTTWRRINKIHVASISRSRGAGLELVLKFSGPGFLKHMIRNCCGFIIDVIEKRRNINDLDSLLGSSPPPRVDAGFCAPSFALVLESVSYQK